MPLPPLKLLLIAGARPNFMKIAPLIKAVEAHNRTNNGDARAVEYSLVHTGQHYDEKMSDIFFRELGIPAPQHNLEIGSGSHAVQTANIMIAFEPVCLAEKPDWVVVVGDVNSTVACTLVASKLGIAVAHIEAGLRSHDRGMPEELNRLVTDALADLLLTPSADGDDNLRREGVAGEKIRCVGNVMIDTLVAQLDRADATNTLERLGLEPGRFVYVTLHRPSNVDIRENLEVIVNALAELSENSTIAFPIHPRTRGRMTEFGLSFQNHPRVCLLEPLGYLDSLNLTRHARFLLTDSGGLQEESTYFRTPCLTLRPNTERPITIKVGSNRLTTIETLRDDIARLLAGPERLGQNPPLWDGHSAERIVAELLANAPS
ncbi:MAG: UDP-N-acetylglucosamine 2-epimerase (non-hydrolyzing) [Verrucomicrobiaceae bacterium]|nr:MAG: UDP-N-acetylglucosamine 2-epimerase (non-hydrolyzing) [Verrucomicrobiaceae bacterium]